MKCKKIIAILLTAAMFSALCGCGKTEAVKAAELAIESIGSVTIDSKEDIDYAEKLYNILTDEEKSKVENRIVLADAIESYDKIVAENAIKEVKTIYESLSEVYDIVDQFGSDIYEAWRVGIHNKDKFKGSNLNGSLEFLASNLFLNYDDVLEGACYSYSAMWGSDWNEKTDEEKQKSRDAIATGTLFYFNQNNIYVACVNCVRYGYLQNGTVDKVMGVIEDVNARLKEIDSNAVGVELKDSVVNLVSVTNAFFEYCQNPTGSFEQSKETINEYRNEARVHISYIDGAL